jgi:hypothetical protein
MAKRKAPTNDAEAGASAAAESALGEDGKPIASVSAGDDETQTAPVESGGGTGDDDLRAALARAEVAVARIDGYEGSVTDFRNRLEQAQSALVEFKAELAEWKNSLTAREKSEADTKTTIATMQTELAALRQSLTEAANTRTPEVLKSPIHGPETAGRRAAQATEISSQASIPAPSQSAAESAPAPNSKPQDTTTESPARKKYRIV